MFEVRSRSWLTPARPPTQFPVARAWRSRWLNRSGRIAELILISFRRAYDRSSWYFKSFTRFANATRKRSSMRSPASLSRLFA